MILQELFDNGVVPWEWTHNDDDFNIAEFSVNGIHYEWQAEQKTPNKWIISFGAEKSDDEKTDNVYDDMNHGITGTGNSQKVMATVVDIIREFINLDNDHIDIDVIEFSAAEPNRQKLYARMINKLIPTWKCKTRVSHGKLVFKLINPE